MQERYNVGGFTLLLETIQNESVAGTDKLSAVVVGIEGSDSRLTIPDCIELGDKCLYVTVIGKKALMGLNMLKHISVPQTVTVLEDWSLAQCIHLETVIIRGKGDTDVTNVNFGRGVFEGCNELSAVCIGYDEVDDKAVLLGAAVWRLPAPYLFKDPDMGKDVWFLSWDKSLASYLDTRDDEGYTNQVLCGEEDISYDGIASVDGELLSDGIDYIRETRKRKCHLCFLRLMADKNLAENYRARYIAYLKDHGIDQKNKEAWLVLKDVFGDDIEYFKLYAKVGCIEDELIDNMLDDLGEQHAEAKAFLIKHKQDNAKADDFFGNLML